MNDRKVTLQQGDSTGALTRAEITERVHEALGVSSFDAKNLVEQVIESIKDELVTGGGKVKISGFGSFIVRKKSARVGRNPKTAREMLISVRKVLVFKPSQILRSTLKQGSR